MSLVIKRSQHLRTSLLTGSDQVCFSSSQIALFFDKKNHQKESTDIFTFLHGDNHQEKVACEGVTFGLVWPMGFQDSLIINISTWKQLIPLSDRCYFLFLFHSFRCILIKLGGGLFTYEIFYYFHLSIV